jgi:tetratricopeptide (TPR) repeat protein
MALAGWERVEALDPDNTLLPVGRGLLYEKMGQTERAQVDYARARTMGATLDLVGEFLQVAMIEGASVPGPFALLECTDHQIRGRVEEAFASCNEALENNPTFADALWKRGQLYAAQGDWEMAVTDYTAAIEADPGWPWVYYLRARALAELGRTAEAQADLTKGLALNPVDELREQMESMDLGR